MKKILLEIFLVVNDETILATNYQLKKRNLNISNSKSSIIFDLDTRTW